MKARPCEISDPINKYEPKTVVHRQQEGQLLKSVYMEEKSHHNVHVSEKKKSSHKMYLSS